MISDSFRCQSHQISGRGSHNVDCKRDTGSWYRTARGAILGFRPSNNCDSVYELSGLWAKIRLERLDMDIFRHTQCGCCRGFCAGFCLPLEFPPAGCQVVGLATVRPFEETIAPEDLPSRPLLDDLSIREFVRPFEWIAGIVCTLVGVNTAQYMSGKMHMSNKYLKLGSLSFLHFYLQKLSKKTLSPGKKILNPFHTNLVV